MPPLVITRNASLILPSPDTRLSCSLIPLQIALAVSNGRLFITGIIRLLVMVLVQVVLLGLLLLLTVCPRLLLVLALGVLHTLNIG